MDRSRYLQYKKANTITVDHSFSSCLGPLVVWYFGLADKRTRGPSDRGSVETMWPDTMELVRSVNVFFYWPGKTGFKVCV
jgi:hypothetical protein